jgi:choline kinase
VVSIAEPDEKPLSSLEDNTRIKKFAAGTSSKRLTGRPVMPSTSSRHSLVSNNSLEDSHISSGAFGDSHNEEGQPHKTYEHRIHQHDKLLLQVSEWLQKEKAKRAAHKSMKHALKHARHGLHHPEHQVDKGMHSNQMSKPAEELHTSKPRSYSQSSDLSEISLDGLQRILEDNMGAFGHKSMPSPSLSAQRPSYSGRKRSSGRKLGSFASSDTEYQDGDVVVPSCDVVLDNSKTMSYSGGVADSSSTTVTMSTSHRAEKERLAWLAFKGEIVRLAHTLRLKGWRRVPLDRGGDIKVERLSGALTNAVYVVYPPQDLPLDASNSAQKHKAPPKLLLRVYGPQVEHLIDRENELGILRRLARKKIGPRLLGTFTNGRFEEYFESQTLTAADLRIPDTSKQIAKRMRELHDGIELLERERQEGPFVWLNWDKWVARCEQVIGHLDRDVLNGKKTRGDSKIRGLVCGVEWNVFRDVVDKYRKWLDDKYSARGGVNKSLVFAHNDVSDLIRSRLAKLTMTRHNMAISYVLFLSPRHQDPPHHLSCFHKITTSSS